MAIMECPDCKRNVSDQAYSCPDCAYPIREMKVQQERAEREKKEADKRARDAKAQDAKQVEPLVSNGAVIAFLAMMMLSVYIFTHSPLFGVVTFLVFSFVLYAQLKIPEEAEKNRASTLADHKKKESESGKQHREKSSAYSNSSSSSQQSTSQRVYVENPRYGKEKILWGYLILLLGAVGFFFNSIIAFILIIIGVAILFIGRAEHWWHWG